MQLRGVFDSGGPLARAITGYQPRASQVEMAQAVAEVLETGGILVAEAGTGTGKTFAYLVPALLSGRQVIVSTASRNLQDQLSHRDLPLLRKALGQPLQGVQLKGRGNYLCHYRLRQSLDADLLRRDEDRADLDQVRHWVAATETGDIAEVAELPESWWGWPLLTSTEDSCLGQNCPFVSDCFLLRARRRAQEADLVVINHHLLCADWALRRDGLGSLLPEVDAVIVDEAHQFAGTAAHFLGDIVTSRQLHELIRDTALELQQARLASPDLRQGLQRLRQHLAGIQEALGGASSRGMAEELESYPQAIGILSALGEDLAVCVKLLTPLGAASQGLESCWQRTGRFSARLEGWLTAERDGWVRWFETGSRRFALHSTPLEVADSFTAYRREFGTAWMFTSATLSVSGDFDHFLNRLGLVPAEVKTRLWPSPFDYRHQALLYLPSGLPQPAASDYSARMMAAVRPVLAASGGRAFLLFTSHRALGEAAGLLAGLPFPLLVQGQAPKAVLLERFRSLGNAVLLGTASFWEGVDVPGAALSCVVIDKLPFASPADPLCRARLANLRRRGYDPFPSWQLPEAVIALKQGAGRLIRGSGDRGVLVLCDPRLQSRSYGKVFLDSLPPLPRTVELAEVERFFGPSR